MALTLEELRAMLSELESDRVERTISESNTDKFSGSSGFEGISKTNEKDKLII